MSSKTKAYILICISIVAFLVMALVGPIPQDHNYHAFADARLMYDVPNFWNVVTNFPLCVIGILGVLAVTKSRPDLNCSCYVFFIGIFFTGIGSAYYHWHPTGTTLVWDRLPMTIAFMGFFSFLIENYISAKAGKQILWPLIGIGLMSIVYWQFSGDLRLYVLVQFLPIILMPFIFLFYKSQHIQPKYVWMMVLFYGIAKLCEGFDERIYSSCELSGHSLKHLFAALAPGSLLLGLKRAKKIF